MAELVPIPLPLLLRRAFHEYEREGKIFDLPKSKFYHESPDLDLSVDFHGHRVSTPLGPAAGPHGQLAQNIALCWLGGSRIIELKTIQILDELKIPRPCIDAANVGYNVEWSQELKLEQSLREYVSAMMLVQILKAGKFPDMGTPVYDMSAGYNLEGIRSPRVSSWIRAMQNAGPVIDELRMSLDGEYEQYRDLPFPTCVSDTISLSTFHGCPAGEIEGIVKFLIEEMGTHVCVKMNPTLLGRQEIEHLLHDVMGYHEIQLRQEAFDNDLQFDEALDLIPRLQAMARAHGKHLSIKFSNTLVVRNHKGYFADEVMYMSGAPLHVITMNLIRKFRASTDLAIPTSFSAGLDANNVAGALAMNLVPVTTCTDLLRPGGYSRLSRYLENLGAKMREAGAKNIPAYILSCAGMSPATDGEQRAVEAAGRLNTERVVAEATANHRYYRERNQGVPRKIGSKLWLYDCIECDKCLPVCPNDANFVYESQPHATVYDNFELTPDSIRPIPGGSFRIEKASQIGNYADACNECGNCDVMCPEDGGPYVEKPRFFGSLETYRQHAGHNGFFIEYAPEERTIHGIFAGGSYVLTVNSTTGSALLEDGMADIELMGNQVVRWIPKPCAPTVRVLDMLPYLQLKLLLESVSSTQHIHFVNLHEVF